MWPKLSVGEERALHTLHIKLYRAVLPLIKDEGAVHYTDGEVAAFLEMPPPRNLLYLTKPQAFPRILLFAPTMLLALAQNMPSQGRTWLASIIQALDWLLSLSLSFAGMVSPRQDLGQWCQRALEDPRKWKAQVAHDTSVFIYKASIDSTNRAWFKRHDDVRDNNGLSRVATTPQPQQEAQPIDCPQCAKSFRSY